MRDPQLKKLQQHENLILYSEIGVLIHDLGKLSNSFIKGHTKKEKATDWVHHTAILDYDCEKGKEELQKKAKKARKVLREAHKLNSEEYKILPTFIYGHHLKNFGKDNEWSKPREFAPPYPNNPFKESGISLKLMKIAQAADKFDSEEDKGNVEDDQLLPVYYSNAFGEEKVINVDFEITRKKLYEAIIEIVGTPNIRELKEKRPHFIKEVRGQFEKGLGETRRAANDVSLWEHSYMTASIFKALLNEYLLSDQFKQQVNQIKISEHDNDSGKFLWKILGEGEDLNSIKDLIKEDHKPIQLLSIGWDHFSFLSQAQKIPDIIGRNKLLTEKKQEIRELIEVEYNLGNKIYEDEQGIHFLIPASFKDGSNTISSRIKEIFKGKVAKDTKNKTENKTRLRGIIVPVINYEKFDSLNEETRIGTLLSKALDSINDKIRKNDLSLHKDALPTILNEWYSTEFGLTCNNCGKGVYKKEEEKICKTCKKVRNRGRVEKMPQTRFIDEISWNGKTYGNIVLFTLNFDLKNWLKGKNIQTTFFGWESRSLKKAEKEKNIDLDITTIINSIIGPEIKKGKQKLGEKAISKIKKHLRKEIESFEYSIKNHEKAIRDLQEKINNERNEEVSKKLRKTLVKEVRETLEEYQYFFHPRPKNASPSRLMRVWNTTHSFFEHIESDLVETIDGGANTSLSERKRYRIKVDPKTSTLVRKWEGSGAIIISLDNVEGEAIIQCEDENVFVEVVTPHLNEYLDETSKKIDFSLQKKEETPSLKVHGEVKEKYNRIYLPLRVFTKSPQQFMFLVNVSETEKVLDIIRKKYQKELGKVYGKLPLNIGLVFGKRKTPLFSMLDSARRFRNNFENIKGNESFQIKRREVKRETGKVLLTLAKHSTSEERMYKLSIPYTLGTGVPDCYHPYLKVKEGGKNIFESQTNNSPIIQKHVLNIEEGDIIELDSSSFDFGFLDSNKRRFDFLIDSDTKKRPHKIFDKRSTKPYISEEIQTLTTLKAIFNKIGNWSPLHDIARLASKKRKEWSNNNEGEGMRGTYDDLIRTLLENRLSKFFSSKWEEHKSFLTECIVTGIYFDALELYDSILNISLGSEKK